MLKVTRRYFRQFGVSGLFKTIVILSLLFGHLAAFASLRVQTTMAGETSAKLGGVSAGEGHSYSALSNPAGLATLTGPAFSAGTSVIGVSLEGSQTNGLGNSPLSPPKDMSTTVWSLGAATAGVGPWNRWWGLGAVLAGPYGSLQSFETNQPNQVFPFRYQGAEKQFQGTLSAALELVPNRLYFGAGLSLFITAAGSADVSVITDNPTGNMALNVKLNSAPLAGFLLTWERTRMSLVYRKGMAPSLREQFTGRVELGGEDVLQQPMLVESTLFFEPDEWDWEIEQRIGEMTLSAGLTYSQWRPYQHSYLVSSTADQQGNRVSTRIPSIVTQNTISPRLGMQWRWNTRWSLSSGYEFSPTPLVGVSQQALPADGDTHRLGLGIQNQFWREGSRSASLGVHGQFHWISEQTLSAGANESYRVSGQAHGIGLSLTARL